MAEHLTVDQVVAGSSPVAHPKFVAIQPNLHAISTRFSLINDRFEQINLYFVIFVRDPCAIDPQEPVW